MEGRPSPCGDEVHRLCGYPGVSPRNAAIGVARCSACTQVLRENAEFIHGVVENMNLGRIKDAVMCVQRAVGSDELRRRQHLRYAG